MTATGHFSECLSTFAFEKRSAEKYSQEQLDKDIARIDEFYLGNGWYIDGLHGQKDYYIWFLHSIFTD